jgi:hypothetical protein
MPSRSLKSTVITQATRSMAGGGFKKGLPTTVPPPTSSVEPLTPPESTKESLMPWDGWFTSFVKSKVGEDRFQKLRKVLLWDDDNVHGLEGMPRPNTKVTISKDGKQTAMFRYPSPGNRKPVNIPGEDDGEDPYFIAHYVRDTSRRGIDSALPNPEIMADKVALLPEDDPRVQEWKEKLAQGPGSSPGNKGVFATGKSDYDPTGLRASMSTNWEALNESLDKYEPNHLPTPCWMSKEDEIIAKWEARGLPCPPGAFQFGTVPTERRVAKWGSGFGGGITAENPLAINPDGSTDESVPKSAENWI